MPGMLYAAVEWCLCAIWQQQRSWQPVMCTLLARVYVYGQDPSGQVRTVFFLLECM
jgi:hypothetical protein